MTIDFSRYVLIILKTNLIRMKLLFATLLLIFASFHCKPSDPAQAKTPRISETELLQKRVPLFLDRKENNLLELKIKIAADAPPLVLKRIVLRFAEGSNLSAVSSVSAMLSEDTPFGSASPKKLAVELNGNRQLADGTHIIHFRFAANKAASLLATFRVTAAELFFSNHPSVQVAADGDFVYRPALVLRAQGQDHCDTYRIPGLVTTNRGTLIAVYDNRYNNSKDLQEDVDIGMSRSTDGGQTWEPMRVILDMGEWGGRPQQFNGAGDPCVLYDPFTHTIWVAALWMSGSAPDQMLWWASKPGMKPEETGQFMLVKSTDDGLTWSPPVNITGQIKTPGWQLLLQGPGRGITMKNGTLVFPAQFKADIGQKALDGGAYTCHSTIVYSRDHGQTWQIGSGAKTNTTEAQVVELADGTLMLNMRDDRNRKDKGETNGRAVAVTADLGKTWTVHPSSNSALPESNCMASLIDAPVKINGKTQQVLFFSNPNNKNERKNMTIKASLDGGLTWPEKLQVELNEEAGYGYSCMTMVDENTVGIIYEGVKEIFFQKVPVNELLNNALK